MIFRAFTLSLQSVSDGKIIALMLKTLAITAGLFILLAVGFWFALGRLLSHWQWDIYGLAAIGAVAFAVLFGWLLWRAIAIAVLWFFSDDIVDAVEARHYPAHVLSAKRPGAVESGKMALRSAGRLIGYNLLAAPLYLLLLITGVGTGIAFLFVNSLLLGRDLQDMLEARHGKGQIAFDRVSRGLLGAVGTAAMLLPLVNLLVPVVATAMAVHLAHLKKPV
ncbi:EI24 domain-containing protein [Sphingorhabdus arenilitoris]|uniref:EI24 domain-containing protein n=1 Tax=Sphingorhabdus arenilitoris TaxID=1490041 RepID=A0ABV8RIS7_9SPHN